MYYSTLILSDWFSYLSGFFSAALLQPLENIKMVIMMPPKNIKLSTNFIKNLYLAFSYLSKEKAITAFYRGLTPNVLKASIGSMAYFSFLRFFENAHHEYKSQFTKNSFVTSFTNSMIARITSTCLCNPFAVIETRYQFPGNQRWTGGIAHNLKRIYQMEGIKGFFKGGLASCYKEGAFAGFYYSLYSEGKQLGLSALTAGLLSGVISTMITHPFEIIKTELQIGQILAAGSASLKTSILGQLLTLLKSGDALKGVTPRLIKKPLTNTLSFILFQYMEKKTTKQ